MEIFKNTFHLLRDDTLACIRKWGSVWIIVSWADALSGESKKVLCYGAQAAQELHERCKSEGCVTTVEVIETLPPSTRNILMNEMVECIGRETDGAQVLWMPLVADHGNHAKLRAVCDILMAYQRAGDDPQKLAMAQVIEHKYSKVIQ